MLCISAVLAATAPSWEASPSQQKAGQFWRYHWYQRGLTNANPAYEGRFRVNAPEISLHPTFGHRVEPRKNGMMLIRAEEDLFLLTAAEFYCEAWGGHPGTANKRITVNGRSTYFLPRFGTEDGHCTYFYPSVPLKITDLVNGYDAVQFALDQGTAFWGHMLVDNAALRVALTNGHPDLVNLGLADFTASVETQVSPRESRPLTPPLSPGGGEDGRRPGEGEASLEAFELRLKVPDHFPDKIARVDFQGWYYDENGNLKRQDWHGYTKLRQPEAWLGSAARASDRVTCDTSMLPAQKDVAVRAVVRFKADTNLAFLTAATTGLEIAERKFSQVVLFAPHDLPTHFWSRAKQLKTCHLDLDLDPARIEKAELHMVTWTDGAGTVKEYFKLNGVHYPIAEGDKHILQYSRLAIEPKNLRRGLNRMELLSDTDHHGIEVIYPRPALMVRYRLEERHR